MEILKQDKELAKEEALETKKSLEEEERRLKTHDEWKRCRQYKYVMSIIEEEIAKASSIQTLPQGASLEELGKFALISMALTKKLEAIKKRLS